MQIGKSLKKNRSYLAAVALFSIITYLVLLLPLFKDINNLFIDPLLGESEIRKEIVIVGIDDKSLQDIGAWPWNRDIFANTLKNISNQEPAVVGLDVLLLESRAGDPNVQEFLSETETPIVFGSKILDDQTILRSVYDTSEGVESGFVNFNQDTDGKIRNTQVFQINNDKCEVSLGLALTAKYLKLNPDELCTNPVELRSNSYELGAGNQLQFSYSKAPFTTISFSDVFKNNIEEDLFKDKIVLIGSTALDVRSELNDNFTDIFGNSIPGVQIHANIVNSFLQNSFYKQLTLLESTIGYIVFAAIFIFLFLKSKKATLDFIIMITLQVANLIAALVSINFGIIVPFIPSALFILAIYIFSLSYRYLTKSRESQYVKTIFSRYLNKDLLNILLNNTDGLKLGGETRTMTVLFSDIRSFTTMSESLKPQELISLLNDYLGYMTSIVLRNKGTVDKYIGDAIMAFWNAPLDDEQHQLNAIKTTLEMKEQLKKFNEMHPEYPEIKIGIGLNTGEMTVGNVGGEDRFDYTVLGDNVNLGSRLEGLTKKYGVTIIVSEAVTKGVNMDGLIFRLLDDMKVKGKNDSVRIYEPMLNNNENQKIKEIYESAFRIYQDGKFKEAMKILKQNSKDHASELLIERIEGLLQNPPTDWNGIWKWDEK